MVSTSEYSDVSVIDASRHYLDLYSIVGDWMIESVARFEVKCA